LDGVGNTKVGHHGHRKERDHGRTVKITSQKWAVGWFTLNVASWADRKLGNESCYQL
jgi:hypothetical protein